MRCQKWLRVQTYFGTTPWRLEIRNFVEKPEQLLKSCSSGTTNDILTQNTVRVVNMSRIGGTDVNLEIHSKLDLVHWELTGLQCVLYTIKVTFKYLRLIIPAHIRLLIKETLQSFRGLLSSALGASHNLNPSRDLFLRKLQNGSYWQKIQILYYKLYMWIIIWDINDRNMRFWSLSLQVFLEKL